ncbi:MAG: glycosyl transferase [Planctomycetota bacterium]
MPELRPLSTLHVSTAKTWRGGENQLYLLAKGLAARGQRVLIVAPPDAPLHARAAEAGLATRAMKLGGGLNPAGLWRLTKLLREVRPEILHLHDSHALTPGQLAGRMLPREACAVLAHRRTAFKIRGRWKYAGRVDRVVAISAAVRAELLEAGLAAPSVNVIYSGLELPEPLAREAPEAVALRAELGVPAGAFLVAHAAALTSEKRQADLIAAVALAEERVKAAGGAASSEIHLALAGSGELEGALGALISERNLRKRVHLLGFRRDLRGLWAAADAAAFVSEAEGLCTALIEAQGAGLAAVITRAGGMVEVVENERTGLTTEVGDVAGIAGALARLAGDASQRARMGRAASERARRLFSSEAMVDGTLALYRELRGVR